MDTKEIATRLAEHCRQGDFEGAQAALFSADAVSLEPYATPDFAVETKGLEAIKAKGKKWNEMVEQVHAIEVTDPIIANNSFALTMRMHVTTKGHGEMDMTELCVYEVKDGKIVSERFFS